ncbi:hypothetical protein H0H92_000032 [Tricholoma furcatifolium]|nr:hypothetical protein H0H92_000032 [Tricholoma furcatifolium]
MPPPPAPPQPSAKFKVGRPPQSAQAEGYQTDRLSNYQHRQDLTFGNQRIPQPPGPSRPGTTRLPQSGQLHSEHVHQAFTVIKSQLHPRRAMLPSDSFQRVQESLHARRKRIRLHSDRHFLENKVLNEGSM